MEAQNDGRIDRHTHKPSTITVTVHANRRLTMTEDVICWVGLMLRHYRKVVAIWSAGHTASRYIHSQCRGESAIPQGWSLLTAFKNLTLQVLLYKLQQVGSA